MPKGNRGWRKLQQDFLEVLYCNRYDSRNDLTFKEITLQSPCFSQTALLGAVEQPEGSE